MTSEILIRETPDHPTAQLLKPTCRTATTFEALASVQSFGDLCKNFCILQMAKPTNLTSSLPPDGIPVTSTRLFSAKRTNHDVRIGRRYCVGIDVIGNLLSSRNKIAVHG